MSSMDVHDWCLLPPEVLVHIFSHIPSSDLVIHIPLVCRAWRDTQHHLVQQLSFWWERLEQEGIQITRDHREDLINNVDTSRLFKLLKSTLLPDITYGIEKELLASKSWDISSKLVGRASVYLMLRTPTSVTIILEPDVPTSKDLDLLFLQLSHTNCEVAFYDDYSCMFKSSLSADTILRHLNRDNVKCKMTSFFGYVTTVNSLPSSICDLFIAIRCDEFGKAIDPGISRLREILPNLPRSVILAVRPGTDLSHIQRRPHYEILYMDE